MTGDYDPRLSVRGAGKAVVLVSGLDGTGQLFYRQVPLLERSHRVATYALRDNAETRERLAADLAEVHLVPSVAQAKYMADRVPGSVLRILSGHGHICLIAPDIDLARILAE